MYDELMDAIAHAVFVRLEASKAEWQGNIPADKVAGFEGLVMRTVRRDVEFWLDWLMQCGANYPVVN